MDATLPETHRVRVQIICRSPGTGLRRYWTKPFAENEMKEKYHNYDLATKPLAFYIFPPARASAGGPGMV